jgi:hypothetical protein
VTTWDPHVSEVSSARCEAVRLHAGAHGSVVHCTVMRAPGLSGGNAQLGRAESKENWTGLRIAGPCAMSPFFYFILFSALFPNLNLNSNLNSSFYGSSPQIIFVRLGVLILNIFIYIYIIYIFISPLLFFLFLNPNFNLGFKPTSSNYYLIIFILIILFNAQTYKLQHDAFFSFV